MQPAARRQAPDSAETGLWGERVAADWLAKAGYSIVGRRVRPALHDEIDIVATKGRILAFVEVKARTSEAFGRPASSVGREKRKALCRAAVHRLFPVVSLRRSPAFVFHGDIVPHIPQKVQTEQAKKAQAVEKDAPLEYNKSLIWRRIAFQQRGGYYGHIFQRTVPHFQ